MTKRSESPAEAKFDASFGALFHPFGGHLEAVVPKSIWLVLLSTPFLYVLAMMAWGGLDYPFWDHIETAKLVISMYNGDLQLRDLVAPHNEHIPFVPRVLQLLLARLNGWNLNVEFTFQFALLVATFGVVSLFLARPGPQSVQPTPWFGLLLIAIFLCSPVGHNNIWWSFMVVLILTAFFAYAAFAAIASTSERFVVRHLMAALLCWLSLLSMANGLLAFLCCALALGLQIQFKTTSIKHKNKLIAYWVLNTIAAFAVTFAVRSDSESSDGPGLISLARFFIIYVGMPLRGLFDFPYANMFDAPVDNAWTLILGVLVLGVAALVCLASLMRIMLGHNRSLFPLLTILFGVGTGVIIALGRAGDDGGALAAASRYTIYATFIYVGIIAYFVQGALPSLGVRRWGSIIASCFAIAFLFSSVKAYADGLRIFEAASAFNRSLQAAYSLGPHSGLASAQMHPSSEVAVQVQREMFKLGLGPYRNYGFFEYEFGDLAAPLVPVPFSNTQPIEHSLDLSNLDVSGVCGIRYMIVTWGERVTQGQLRLTIEDLETSSVTTSQQLLHGLRDWESFDVRIPEMPERARVTFELTEPANTTVGLPGRRMQQESGDVVSYITSAQSEESPYLPATLLLCR